MSKTVLIVEDEPYLRQVVSKKLKKAGYRVKEAGSLAAARAILEVEQPDLALLDLNLPDGVGFSLVPAIKSQGNGAKVLVMSAYTSADELERAEAEGIDLFLAKPFRMPELLEAVTGQCPP